MAEIYKSKFPGQEIDERLELIPELQEGVEAAQQAADGKYTKPASGIPMTDLSDEVREAIEEGGGQADWAQTDTTAPDYIKNKPSIPTHVVRFVQQFLSDSERIQARANIGAGTYTKPSGGIPESDLADDVIPDVSEFITASVSNLVNYYLKSDTYSRSEVQQLIAAIQGVSFVSVASLPTPSADTMGGKIYLVPSANPDEQNVKDEFITIQDGNTYTWEQIGSTAVNLSGYVTTQQLNTALAAYTTTEALTTLLAAKQDTISDLSTIRSGAAAGAKAYQKPQTGIPASDLAPGVIPTVPTDVVKYSSQSLTDAEKTQARTNIGAAAAAALTALETAIAAKYTKPSSGIPETDLASGVQSALALARTSIQSLADYYSKTEVDALLAAVNSEQYVDVATLPTASADTLGKIYLVGPTNGVYDRYYTSYDGTTYSWVGVGTTEINLANYATKAELNQLSQKVDDIDIQIQGQESNFTAGKYLDSSGAEIDNVAWGISDYIPCVKTDAINWSWGGAVSASGPCLIIYNASKEVVTYYGVKTDGTSSRSFTNNYSASAYIRVSFLLADLDAVGVSINNTAVWSPRQKVDGVKPRLSTVEEELATLTDTVETLQGKTGAESALMERKSIAEDSPYYFLQSDASYNGSHLDNIVRSVPAGRSFIFTTDAHWDNSNSKNCHFLIDYIKKRLGISTVVFGGDAIGNVQDSKYAGANVLAQYSEELFSAFGKNVLWVQGNHDTNVPGIPVWMPDTSYAVGRRVVNFENRGCYKCIVANSDATFDLSKWEAEDLFIDDEEINKRTINHLGSVVYDDAGIERMAAIISNPADKAAALAWMKRHYHYDDAEKKLRYIILETFDYGFAAHIVFGGYGTYYLQFDWLAETLKSTPQGYTIIVCGHQVNSGSETSFYTQRLYQLIAAYLNAGSISITLRRANTSLTDSAEQDNYGYIHEFWGSSSPTVGKAKTFDFTGVTPCKLFCIGGHYHMDDAFLTRANTSTAANVQSLEYAATTPVAGDILTIFSNRNCWNRRYESDRATKYPNSMSPEMTVDTITEQSFDIVTITEDGRIVCTRVGAGESRTFVFPALP